MKYFISTIAIILFNAFALNAHTTKINLDDFETIGSSSRCSIIQNRSDDSDGPSSQTFFIEIGKEPIRIEPTNNIRIINAHVHDNRIVAGVYKKKNDSVYIHRLFVFNGNTKKFIDLPAPCPNVWEIEEGRILGILANGNVFYYLFLDHSDSRSQNTFASLFDEECINCSYNVHTKQFTYYLNNRGAIDVYNTKNNQSFKKPQDKTRKTYIDTFYPLFLLPEYSSEEINDRGYISGEIYSEIYEGTGYYIVSEKFVWDMKQRRFLNSDEFPELSNEN
jgi:hypothetical protein